MAFSSIARELNRNHVKQSINDFGIYTKQDISRKTSLSFPTTGKIVDALVQEGMIQPLRQKRGDTGGRKASEYQLNKEYAYSLCMLIELDHMKAVITNLAFEEKHTAKKTVQGALTAEHIQSFVQELIDSCPEIRSIAIGVPGAVHNGKIFLIDGFKQLQDYALEDLLRDKFHIPTVVLNNMNALISGFRGKIHATGTGENIACIHIGEKGPGCSFLVNGAPVSGFCGFQGEIGFNLFDQTQTFREIALNKYQNVSLEAYIGRLMIQIITMINPHQIMIYMSDDSMKTDIYDYCLHYLPHEVLPQITYLDSYEKDYIFGLMNVGLKQILHDITA